MIVFIHRKDLRIHDMPGFAYIRRSGQESLHLFIADPRILTIERRSEPSGQHFLQLLARLAVLYAQSGSRLHVLHGTPEEVMAAVLERHAVTEIVVHEDVTPYARERDQRLRTLAVQQGVPWTALPDLPLADLGERKLWSGRREPYKVFTPFYRRWSEFLAAHYVPADRVSAAGLQTRALDAGVAARFALPFPLPETDAGLLAAPEVALSTFVDERLGAYSTSRDAFAREGTSGVSRFLNAGALSVRDAFEALPAAADKPSAAWQRQLAWRDFYLYQAANDPLYFRYEDTLDFSELTDRHFGAWCRGQTGIPIVDAAMRQLNATGEMPNRLRMVTAMFLTKNLLCPFPLGEAYFRLKLLDADNVLNRGGWLWSSSVGFDASPYFRIMNPVTQSETHNPSGSYIREWLPERAGLSDRDVHKPSANALVDLKASRARAIEVYRTMFEKASKKQL